MNPPISPTFLLAEATAPLELRQGIAGQLDLRRGAALQQLHLAGYIHYVHYKLHIIYILCILFLLNIDTYMYVCMYVCNVM